MTPLGQRRNASRALTKAEFAYETIRESILRGEMEPGHPLDQDSLAQELGVSTTPLREALRRLESEYLVVSRVHRDTIVAPLSVEVLEEVYVVRHALEPLAVRLACKRASDSEIEHIRSLVEQEPARQDAISLMGHSSGIHRAIFRMSHNAVLSRTLDSLSDMMDRFRAITFRQDPTTEESSRSVHLQIVDAMEKRDADVAYSLMSAHLEDGYERMRARSRELQQPPE